MGKLNLSIVSVLFVTASLIYGCGEGVEAGEASHGHAPESVTGTRSEGQLSGKEIDGVREIRLEAFQFGFKPEVIVVKKGERVRLVAKSTDVTHGIAIAAFDVSQALPPNEDKTIEFTADKVGEFHFHCSVYCGTGHGKMHGKLIVRE